MATAKGKKAKATAELVKLEVINPFYDKQLIEAGTTKAEALRIVDSIFEATEERATELEAKGFVRRLD